MRIYTFLTILFLQLIIGASLILTSASAEEGALIFIEPSMITGTNYAPSTDLMVAVLIANITDLAELAFNISYKSLILSFRGLFLKAIDHGPSAQWQVHDKKGFLWLNITFKTPVTTSDPITLVNITFLILARGETMLDIHDIQLISSTGQLIFHVANDAYFNNCSPYDVNQDGKIDIADVSLVAYALGSYPGHPRWNPNADVDRDGEVDMQDIVIVAGHYGYY
jgi:hypothetical protein